MSTRPAKLDAWLSTALAACVTIIIIANLISASPTRTPAAHATLDLILLITLAAGVVGSIALAARVFWRHRIHLAAWMTMFVINAIGLLLATQLFRWLHPGVSTAPVQHAQANANLVALDAALLALALAAVLLVRGAALLKDARRMPDWMARHNKNGDAMPRLWLFSLFWITPLAWWGLLLCALFYANGESDSRGLKVIAFFCIFIIVVRTAVRLVLFEKNKFTNWQRSAVLRPKFLAWAHAAGMTCAALLTFYAYLVMSTQTQMDALMAHVASTRAGLIEELAEYKSEPIEPKANAETLYKLARTSAVRVNFDWAKTSWRTPEADLEISKNLTALSYFRQSVAYKAVDYGVDWTDFNAPMRFYSTIWTMAEELPQLATIELRAAAAKGNWPLAHENFAAGLQYAHNHGELLPTFAVALQLNTENNLAGALTLALLEPGAQPDDRALVQFQTTLTEYLKTRPVSPMRSLYFSALTTCIYYEPSPSMSSSRWRNINVQHPNLRVLIDGHPLLEWGEHNKLYAPLLRLKLLSRERPDAKTIAEFVKTHDNFPNGALYQAAVFAQLDRSALTRLRLLECALGVIRYRRYHGRLPSKLDDCVPQFLSVVPLDPFMPNERIRYEAAPPARVYSAGQAAQYAPESHGSPPENRFDYLMENLEAPADRNLVLFLSN